MPLSYRAVYTTLQDDLDFQSLSPDAQRLFFYLRTCDDCGPIGLFRYYPETFQAKMRLSARAYQGAEKALRRPKPSGEESWVEVEWGHLWIRNAMQYEPNYKPRTDKKHYANLVTRLEPVKRLAITRALFVKCDLPWPKLWPIEGPPEALPSRERERDPERDPEREPERKNLVSSEQDEISPNGDIRTVYEHYLKARNIPESKYKLTPTRSQKIRLRLKDNTVAALCCVIDTAVADDFFGGNNDRNRIYLDLEKHLFKSYEQVEKWLNKAEGLEHGKKTR